MLTTVTLGLAAVVLGLLAVAMGWVLGWANRAFFVAVDPRVAAINGVLPGANCGGCGYVGCGEYAEAVAGGDAEATLCGPGGVSCAQVLGQIMGVEISEAAPYRAVVHCAATSDQRLLKTPYIGEQNCTAANLVAGVQGCVYGCLGLGDCHDVCDYDAIHIINGVAVVDYDNCIGCKACAIVCPRNIISMVPFKTDRMLVVACSNQDMGKDVKTVCEVGCISCKACTKFSSLLTMEGNIPAIDYDHYDPVEDLAGAVDKCPMESLVFVGKPTSEDIDALADVEMPARVEADFKSTVDDTEWRG